MTAIAAFLVGLLFGLGLIVSGMSDPAKVLGFLDLGAIPAGGWDPSLAFVMAGAVAVAFLGFRLVRQLDRPLCGGAFHWPAATAIEARTLLGPALFGIGWGLAGFCPGPALTALVSGGGKAGLFVLAMLVGMAAARWLARRA
jgi:uncharacterized membrane protein YedE/YeeE